MPRNSFLDQGGLGYLWSKVLSRISSSESSITAKIPIASDDLPKDLGSSSSGVSSKFSRSDHVHKVPDDIVSYADAQTGVEETTKINADLLENHPASDFAPGGFGLGGAAKVLTPADNLNDVWQAGWYSWDAAPQNAPTVGGSLIAYCSMNVLNKSGNYNIHQIIYTFEGYEIHRYYDGSKRTWSEYAWVNPPMMAGVEYRTTEYYLGKPVYARLHDFGALPNNMFKEDSSPASWSIDKPICAYGTTSEGITIPTNNYGGMIVDGRRISMYFMRTELTIATDADRTNISATIFLKYTKTTD